MIMIMAMAPRSVVSSKTMSYIALALVLLFGFGECNSTTNMPVSMSTTINSNHSTTVNGTTIWNATTPHSNRTKSSNETEEVVIVYVRGDEEFGDFTSYPEYAVALIVMVVAIVGLGIIFFMCPEGWSWHHFIEDDDGLLFGDDDRSSHHKQQQDKRKYRSGGQASSKKKTAEVRANSILKPPNSTSTKAATSKSKPGAEPPKFKSAASGKVIKDPQLRLTISKAPPSAPKEPQALKLLTKSAVGPPKSVKSITARSSKQYKTAHSVAPTALMSIKSQK